MVKQHWQHFRIVTAIFGGVGLGLGVSKFFRFYDNYFYLAATVGEHYENLHFYLAATVGEHYENLHFYLAATVGEHYENLHFYLAATVGEHYENLHFYLAATVGEHYENLHFYQGLNSIMSYLRWANVLVQNHEPWKLVKSDTAEDTAYRKTVIHMALETLRVGGVLLQPVIPKLSQMLLDRLGIPEDRRTVEHARTPYLNSPECLPLGPNTGPLLERIVVKDKLKVADKQR